MAANYFYIRNIANKGELAISRHVFESIALEMIDKNKGIKPYRGKKNPNNKTLNLYRPVTCTIKRDNVINLHVEVAITNKSNIKPLCEKLQEDIAQAILLTCETLTTNIDIEVMSVSK